MENEKIKDGLPTFEKSIFVIVILFHNFKYKVKAKHIYRKSDSDFIPLICCPFLRTAK